MTLDQDSLCCSEYSDKLRPVTLIDLAIPLAVSDTRLGRVSSTAT
jgi:hypothetical protein